MTFMRTASRQTLPGTPLSACMRPSCPATARSVNRTFGLYAEHPGMLDRMDGAAQTPQTPPSDSPMDRLALAIRRERQTQGLSLSETAQRAGIGQSPQSPPESHRG